MTIGFMLCAFASLVLAHNCVRLQKENDRLRTEGQPTKKLTLQWD